MSKIAFLTMDVESFFDTSCIKKLNVVPDARFDCAEQIKVFADVLKEREIVGTFFVVTDFLPYCTEYLKYAKECGNEIALHAKEHIEPTKLASESFSEEIDDAVSCLSRDLGITPKGYRAPCFSTSDDTIDRIKEKGFRYDASLISDKTEWEKINKVVYKKDNFFRFSLNKEKFLGQNLVVSGGGYLRFAPFFVVKKRIKRIIERGDEYVLYVHPFELFGGKLPKIKGLTLHERFYIDFRRKSYKKHITEIIDLLIENGYKFLTMAEFVENYK